MVEALNALKALNAKLQTPKTLIPDAEDSAYIYIGGLHDGRTEGGKGVWNLEGFRVSGFRV